MNKTINPYALIVNSEIKSHKLLYIDWKRVQYALRSNSNI